MSTLLLFLSYFGVLQGLVLALAFYRKGEGEGHHRPLAALFAGYSLVMLEITLSNSYASLFDVTELLETTEYALTFAAGPAVWLLARRLLGRPSLPAGRKAVHFLVPILFLVYAALVLAGGAQVSLPIWVPLLYFQAYTLWLLMVLRREGVLQADAAPGEPERWLMLIAGLLMLLHLAQWARFFLSGVEELRLLVPAAAFLVLYLLSAYALLRSDLFALRRKYRDARLTEKQMQDHRRELVRLLEEEAVHTDRDLSLESLGERMDVPPHLLSQVINRLMGVNFNRLVNRYRVASARKYLEDPALDHFTIEAIAEKSGFSSRSSFYTAFKEETGRTPAAFRP